MVALPLRPAAALLSRAALKNNLKVLKDRVRGYSKVHRPDAEIMAVVKADAYGHDLGVAMPELLRSGIRRFALASVSEAIEARKISRSADLVVLGGTFKWSRSSIDLLRKHRLEIAVNDLETLKVMIQYPELKLHLKLDTGMNRLGLKPEYWGEAVRLIKRSNHRLAGLLTHYATAGDTIFESQVRVFEEAVRWLFSEGIKPRWIHSENTAAVFSRTSCKRGILSEVSNLVRPGLALWGYLPYGMKNSFGLSPVLELVSEIGLLKMVEKGEGISYGHHYRAASRHPYGVVPLGYADGLSKEYAQSLRVELRTRNDVRKGSLNVCGSICMDMVMVRSKTGKMVEGDRAVFWGRFPNSLLNLHIVEPYELNLRIAKRIPRIWVS